MAKNPQKYVYLTIGIKRGSRTHLALLEDADNHDSKRLPTIASLRLSNFYEMLECLAQGGIQAQPKKKAPEHIDGDVELIDAANAEWPE